MAVNGSIQGGGQWHDVFLWSPRPASALAIALVEDAQSDAVWECRVVAKTEHGSFHLGVFRTRPPSVGEIPSRLVGIAFYPGALSFLTSWRLVSGGDPAVNGADRVAYVRLTSTDAAGTLPGVTPLLSRGGATSNRTFQFQPNTANAALTPASSNATLFRVDAGLVNANVAGANAWVQLFDQAAAPVAGDVPFWSQHLGQAAAGSPPDGSEATYDAGPSGRPIANRLWIATSDAPGQLVVSAQQIQASSIVAYP